MRDPELTKIRKELVQDAWACAMQLFRGVAEEIEMCPNPAQQLNDLPGSFWQIIDES